MEVEWKVIGRKEEGSPFPESIKVSLDSLTSLGFMEIVLEEVLPVVPALGGYGSAHNESKKQKDMSREEERNLKCTLVVRYDGGSLLGSLPYSVRF